MLTEQRYEIILQLLAEKKSITVTEVKELLDTSESTVRRDISALHKAGKLTRVFGGAIALEHTVISYEPTVAQKEELNLTEKHKIAAAAAALIEVDDFIYLDAGTTTAMMIEHLENKNITVVTNAVSHAKKLAGMGVRVFLIGGELKGTTEAVVGNQAMKTLMQYHFTKGFFGTNGITAKGGFTTPDANEALVKETAMGQCEKAYVLADGAKFDQISSVSFGKLKDATVLTNSVPQSYKTCSNMIEIA